jgi:hypothetical protein
MGYRFISAIGDLKLNIMSGKRGMGVNKFNQ